MPVFPYQTPDWLKPENESVMDSLVRKGLKAAAKFIGVDDPNAAVMGVASPMAVISPYGRVPVQELRKLADPNVLISQLMHEEGPYVDTLAQDIAKRGVQEPVSIELPRAKDIALNPPPVINDGHHRIAAAIKLGMPDLPVKFWPHRYDPVDKALAQYTLTNPLK